ncbi:hypothetical protein OEV98_02880 [Caldibacillus lycopersici]|uniref:Uncharacterized protein n=1 Tax=Perspicuibacillus lycopersici TaxID=1325689 RepID=A0AAE3LS98_9BACI|nr:hypothetical protein [Perspicuibacillus lycopersici]MCU9612508.1 hypothetical protein [Perspicuibacillus lycopersici]
MEGIIFGVFALSIVLYFGTLQCLHAIKAASNNFYRAQMRKRFIVLFISADLFLLMSIVLFYMYY